MMFDIKSVVEGILLEEKEKEEEKEEDKKKDEPKFTKSGSKVDIEASTGSSPRLNITKRVPSEVASSSTPFECFPGSIKTRSADADNLHVTTSMPTSGIASPYIRLYSSSNIEVTMSESAVHDSPSPTQTVISFP